MYTTWYMIAKADILFSFTFQSQFAEMKAQDLGTLISFTYG